MAGTSLARQLAALRTPGAVAAVPTSVYSGPFLFPEAEREHSSLASLREAVADCLSQLCSKDSSLARYSVLLQDHGEEGDKETDILLADCLHALSSHMLLRPAQWVLQWLVIRHKVHLRLPGVLMFSLLPHHNYRIYQAVLDTIDTEGLSHKAELSWLGPFKQACSPTSQLALHRHVASSTAFLSFLCEGIQGLVEHLSRHPATRPHKQATLVLTTLLGGLQNCADVGEKRLQMLLQPILSGFRCLNTEVSSLSSILLGYLLPRVSFRPKAVNKLCKSVARYARSVDYSEDSLCLVLLLVRTQSPTSATLPLVVSHEAVINSMVNLTESGGVDEAEDTLDSLAYSLSVVLEQFIPSPGEVKLAASQEEVQLVELLVSCTRGVGLSGETAGRIVGLVGELMNGLQKDNNNQVDCSLDPLTKQLKLLLSNVQKSSPSAYQENMEVGSEADILFIPGVESPSAMEVEQAKVLGNSQLVTFLSKDILVEFSQQKVKKIIKKNVSELITILQADNKILVSKLGDGGLERVLFNLLLVTDNQFPELQELVVAHLCSDSLITSLPPSVLDLTLLPHLLTWPAPLANSVLRSSRARLSPLLSLLSSLSPNSGSFPAALLEKLVLILTPAQVQTIFSTPTLLNNYGLCSLILHLAPLLTKSDPPHWSPTLAQLALSLVSSCNFSDSGEDKADLSGLVGRAKEQGSVSWDMLLPLLIGLSGEQEVMETLVLIVLKVTERKWPELALKIRDIIQKKLGHSYLKFLLELSLKTSDLKLVYFSLTEAQQIDCSKTPSDQLSQTILFVIHFSLHQKPRIQKAAFSALEKLMGARDKTTSLGPLVAFLVRNKAELVNNVENLADRLIRDKVEPKACQTLLELSLKAPPQIFVNLANFFVELRAKKNVEGIFQYGQSLLESDQGDESLTVIVKNFMEHLCSNLDVDVVWKFLATSLVSLKVVVVAGVPRKLAQLLLTGLSSTNKIGQLSEDLTCKMLSLLTRLSSMQDCSLPARQLAIALKPFPNSVLGQLKEIWGDDAFQTGRVSGRGKFSLLYGSEASSEEATERWSKTCWILETLDKLVVVNLEKDWRLLTRPLFMLLRKVADLELEDGTYKLSLLLGVLLRLLTALPDTQLLELESGQLDPELLVHCIRTSPSPDTRHTALQVLARCAVANPDFILHNSITIFTFMGSHLLKVDSRRSFHVACEALDVIIPAIKTACSTPGRSGQLATTCLSVLTTFVDASQDIPAHRLSEFLVRLINCLGEKEHLWVAALLLIRKDRTGGERKVVELFCQFSSSLGVESLLRLLVNTRGDAPHLRKMFGVKLERKEEVDKPDDWDLLRLRALQVATIVLSAPKFANHVGSSLGDEQVEEMLNLLIEAAILTIHEYEDMKVVMPVKFKKSLVSQSERVLESSLALLPGDLFLGHVGGLLGSKTANVRHRALEVVSSKLTPPCPLPLASLPSLVSPLVVLAKSEELAHTQQLALLAVRQLAKLLPDSNHLQEAGEAFSCSFLTQITNPKVLGAAVISCADVMVSLGPLAVPRVPPLADWLASELENWKTSSNWTAKEVAVVHNSFLYCLQRLVETFVGFLHPLAGRIVVLGCKLGGLQSSSSGPRAKMFLDCLATCLPTHSVLSQAPSLLETIWTSPSSVPPFVNFVAGNCRQLEKGQLTAVSKQVVALFTMALGFRAKHTGENTNPEEVSSVEESIITAFLSVALRLSLEEFRPVYQQLVTLYHSPDDIAQQITMFNLTDRIGSKLKSLFSFGLENTVQLVTNSLKTEKSTELVNSCLSSLTTLLTYNKIEPATGVSLPQYESLVGTLLADWLLPSPTLTSCLVRLAASTPDDTAWKFLHYQLLLALRDRRADVRVSVLSVLCEVVTDRTDTYLPVLPDAVPFLQEILEDDDQIVENKCREFIQHMETTFGQNIESYFV